MPEKTIRFGITDNTECRAATWKLWTPGNKADIYLTCRALGKFLKTSFHQSGKWHVAYNQSFFEGGIQEAIPSQEDRFIQKWPRPKPIASGVTLAFRIVTPFSAVTLPLGEVGEEIVWIPNCPTSKATEIDIIIVAPSTPVTGWPGKNKMGTKLVGSYELATGDTVWVVYQVIDMPDLSLSTNGSSKFYRGRSLDDLKTGKLRAIVFGNEPDGSRVIYDCEMQNKNS